MASMPPPQAMPQQPGGGQAPPPPRRPSFTPEQQAEIDKYNAELVNWRSNFPVENVAKAKKLFDDAGINVHIVKFAPERWSDGEIDYAFKAAKAMGAKAVTNETGLEAAKRLGPFAEKHGMYIALHNHMQFAEKDFDVDAILAASPAVMLNFDAGHYFGSTGLHPNDFIRKYHDRIYSIHIKDKTGPNAVEPNANQVFGQGETPVEEIMLLVKQEKWPIYFDIELEYTIKPWSDAVKEVKNCVNFLREILL
jgi:sugar phosphate isomerase/epimerase